MMTHKRYMPLRLIIQALLVVLLAGFSGISRAQEEGYQLNNKQFYLTIFDSNDLQAFQRAKEKEQRGKELEEKASVRYKAANKALKRREAATSSGTRKKANRRYKWKKFWADFHYKRALKRYYKADKWRLEVYNENIAPIRLDDDSKFDKKGHALESQADEMFHKAQRKTDDMPSDRERKIELLEQGDSLLENAIAKMKLAYGIYKKDSAAAARVFKKDKPGTGQDKGGQDRPDLVVEKFEEQYAPARDQNIYRSIKDRIFRKLNLTRNENRKIQQAYQKQARGDTLYAAINEYDRNVLRRRRLIGMVEEKAQKEQLKSEIRSLQMEMVLRMLRKAQNYIEANQAFYQVLQGNFKEVKQEATPEEGRQMERFRKEAQKYKNRADEIIQDAKDERFRADKYRLLMNANEELHQALQQFEAAYSTGLNLQFADRNVDVVDVFDVMGEDFSTAGTGTQEEDGEEAEVKKPAGSYEFVDRYTYNEEGEAVKAEAPDGLVFRIQAGIMRQLPQRAASYLPPVYYDTFKGRSLKRFYMGEFRTLEAAGFALDSVHAKFYGDAFVVPFVNGKRISKGYARQLIQNNEFMSEAEYEKARGKELAALGDKAAKAAAAERVHVKGLLGNTKGLVFTVQLGIFDEVPQKDQVAGIDSVFRGETPIGKRYTFGQYKTFQKAHKLRNEIATNGNKKAFVVAYNDGAWIDINKARSLYDLKESGQQKATASGGDVVYRVQIGAFKESGRFAQLRKKLEIKEIPAENDMISYTVGKFTDYSKAIDKRDELLSKGIEGFVVAYKGNSRIALTEAKDAEREETEEAETTGQTTEEVQEQEEVSVTFYVQVGAYSDPLSEEQKQRFNTAAEDWELQMRRDAQNRYLYLLGAFDYYEEAVQFQKQLRNKGVEGFVVAYRGDEKLSLEAARKMK